LSLKLPVRSENPSGMTSGAIAIFGEVLADVFPDQQVLGGAPFNVARHLRGFGLDPRLISRIGNDVLGDALLDEMVSLDMEVTGIQLDDVFPTGQVQVLLENGRHHFNILPDQAYDQICHDATLKTLEAMQPRLAYFGSLVQRSEKSRLAGTHFVEHCKCPLFLDINLRAPWYDVEIISASFQHADIVKLNDEELAVISRMFDLESLRPEAQALALQQRFEVKQVLVTCGEFGSWLLDEHQQMTRAAPVVNGSVVDTVGAGDAFAAVFMLGQLGRWSIPVTLQRASEYAAAICGVRGAAAPSAAFVKGFKETWELRCA